MKFKLLERLCVTGVGGVREVFEGTGAEGLGLVCDVLKVRLCASKEHRDTMFVAYITAVTTHW